MVHFQVPLYKIAGDELNCLNSDVKRYRDDVVEENDKREEVI